MNEETTIPAETGDSVPGESSALEVEATDPSVVPEALIPVETEMSLADWFTEPTEAASGSETLPYYAIEETVAETVVTVTVDVIQDGVWSIINADLFGSFLICGTLVGCTLLRNIYGLK